MNLRIFLLAGLVCCLAADRSRDLAAQDAKLQAAIDAVKAIQVGGQGHDAALAAMEVLNSASASDVPQMLQAMEGANKIALNWLPRCGRCSRVIRLLSIKSYR